MSTNRFDMAKNIDQTQRRTRAIEMRRVGIPWEKISEEVGYSSPAAAAADIAKVLSDRSREMGDQVIALRSIESDKLDAMERVIIGIMRKPHILAQQGKVVINPITKEPEEDPGPIFQCIDRLLRIAERRAKLMGIDAPVKAHIEVKAVGVDAEIAGILAGMVTGREEETPSSPQIRPVEKGGQDRPTTP